MLLQLAFDIYDRLKRSGLELTLHSYHTALKGSRYLKAAGLQTLYAELMGRHDLILKDKTFGYVFRAAATCGDHLPASWIIQVQSARQSVAHSCLLCIMTAMSLLCMYLKSACAVKQCAFATK